MSIKKSGLHKTILIDYMQKPQETAKCQWEVALTRKYSWRLSATLPRRPQPEAEITEKAKPLPEPLTSYTPQLVKAASITPQMPHYLTEIAQPITAPETAETLWRIGLWIYHNQKISRMVIVDSVKLAQSNTPRPKKPPTYFPQAIILQDATLSHQPNSSALTVFQKTEHQMLQRTTITNFLANMHPWANALTWTPIPQCTPTWPKICTLLQVFTDFHMQTPLSPDAHRVLQYTSMDFKRWSGENEIKFIQCKIHRIICFRRLVTEYLLII